MIPVIAVTFSSSGLCFDLRFCLGICSGEKHLRLWNLTSRINDQTLTYNINKLRSDGSEEVVPMGKTPRYIFLHHTENSRPVTPWHSILIWCPVWASFPALKVNMTTALGCIPLVCWDLLTPKHGTHPALTTTQPLTNQITGKLSEIELTWTKVLTYNKVTSDK